MRIAIVDDDAKERSLLKDYAERYAEEKKLDFGIVEFDSGLNFSADYAEPFDIILLDIEMPHLDGLKVAREIRKVDTAAVIIFITRMAQYAIKGYEVDALDFMLKPVTYFNLSAKLSRAMKVVPMRNVVKLDVAAGGVPL